MQNIQLQNNEIELINMKKAAQEKRKMNCKIEKRKTSINSMIYSSTEYFLIILEKTYIFYLKQLSYVILSQCLIKDISLSKFEFYINIEQITYYFAKYYLQIKYLYLQFGKYV